MVRINSDSSAKRNATHVFVTGPVADGAATECQPGRKALIARCALSCKMLYLNCNQVWSVGYQGNTTNPTDVKWMQTIWILFYRPMSILIEFYPGVVSGQTVTYYNRPACS